MPAAQASGAAVKKEPLNVGKKIEKITVGGEVMRQGDWESDRVWETGNWDGLMDNYHLPTAIKIAVWKVLFFFSFHSHSHISRPWPICPSL